MPAKQPLDSRKRALHKGKNIENRELPTPGGAAANAPQGPGSNHWEHSPSSRRLVTILTMVRFWQAALLGGSRRIRHPFVAFLHGKPADTASIWACTYTVLPFRKPIPPHLVWVVQKRDRTISVGGKRVVVLDHACGTLFSTGAESVLALCFKKQFRSFRPSENTTSHRAFGVGQNHSRGGKRRGGFGPRLRQAES